MLPGLRLFQLISPTLPVGSFTYSQGLEWAVEAQWVNDKATLESWLEGLLDQSIATLELPILLRLHEAFAQSDEVSAARWCNYLLASRETSELRKEERQRGAALGKLLPNLGVQTSPGWKSTVTCTQLAGMALAAKHWDIKPLELCQGYAWSWLENSVLAGVKLVPLGQTQGQQILLQLAEKIPAAIHRAGELSDNEIGSSTPSLAIASSNHETQYTRLFRS